MKLQCWHIFNERPLKRIHRDSRHPYAMEGQRQLAHGAEHGAEHAATSCVRSLVGAGPVRVHVALYAYRSLRVLRS